MPRTFSKNFFEPGMSASGMTRFAASSPGGAGLLVAAGGVKLHLENPCGRTTFAPDQLTFFSLGELDALEPTAALPAAEFVTAAGEGVVVLATVSVKGFSSE